MENRQWTDKGQPNSIISYIKMQRNHTIIHTCKSDVVNQIHTTQLSRFS